MYGGKKIRKNRFMILNGQEPTIQFMDFSAWTEKKSCVYTSTFYRQVTVIQTYRHTESFIPYNLH